MIGDPKDVVETGPRRESECAPTSKYVDVAHRQRRDRSNGVVKDPPTGDVPEDIPLHNSVPRVQDVPRIGINVKHPVRHRLGRPCGYLPRQARFDPIHRAWIDFPSPADLVCIWVEDNLLQDSIESLLIGWRRLGADIDFREEALRSPQSHDTIIGDREVYTALEDRQPFVNL